jgi:predicted ATPase
MADRELPTGTVTFLFTDIEGSTRLLRELGEEGYAVALVEHRRVLRDSCARHGGVEVDSQGDALFVAFPTAPGALEAAREAQAQLSLPVRMGVHTGTPLLTMEGYVGGDVHRAARIAAAGHGRQILVSASTAALVLPGEGLRDLGEHRLKDLSAPERIYQVGDDEFPRLNTLYQTNLPVQPQALIGRERELAEVCELVRANTLVTLTGPGGAGKTRLALQAAAELAEEFPDGVWFVSLASFGDAAPVESTIAQVLRAPAEVNDFVRQEKLLLVLDNLEHLLPEVSLVVASLQAPVLATSRERLNVSREQEYPLPSLEAADAAALFRQRARQLKPDFQADHNVAEIARRLDGLPLALELAAARVKVLTPEQILARLGKSLDLLTSGAVDAPARQRTMRATIEWSVDLLDEIERRLFARLATFAGSFDLEAAEAVAGADVDSLGSLLDKSLLGQTGDGRLFMLETIREYAAELLEPASDHLAVRRAHANYYAELGEHYDEVTRPNERPAAFARLAPEVDNVRTAFATAISERDHELALRLATVAGWFRLPVREWHQLFEAALGRGREFVPDLEMRALLRATFVAKEVREPDQAEQLYEQLIAAAGRAGDGATESIALGGLGDVALIRGDQERAQILYKRALTHADKDARDGLFHALGELAMASGDGEQAATLFDRALEGARTAGDLRLTAKILHSLGDLALRQDDLDRAASAYREGAATARPYRDPKSALYCLAGLAAVAARRGQTARAQRLWAAVEAAEDEYPLDQDYRTFYRNHLGAIPPLPVATTSFYEVLDSELSQNL